MNNLKSVVLGRFDGGDGVTKALCRGADSFLSLTSLLNTAEATGEAKYTAETERLPTHDGDEKGLEPEPKEGGSPVPS